MAPRTAPLAALLLLLLLPLLAAGCDIVELDPEQEDRDEWVRQRVRWERAGVRDYTYLLAVSCFCGPEQTRTVEVVVRDGTPVSVTHYEDGTPASRALFARFDTVDELFDVIGDAFDRDADYVAALYETRDALGYPESVILDYSEFTADDELSFVVLDLEIDS